MLMGANVCVPSRVRMSDEKLCLTPYWELHGRNPARVVTCMEVHSGLHCCYPLRMFLPPEHLTLMGQVFTHIPVRRKKPKNLKYTKSFRTFHGITLHVQELS